MMSRCLPLLLCIVIVVAPDLPAQTWTPAGQMVGQRMSVFPLSLPDGSHLIPLRWVHQRKNDSTYWFDIKSIPTTPKMYERQTLGLRTIDDVNDYDSDGYLDLAGRKVDKSGILLWAALSDREHTRTPVPDRQSMAYGVTNRYFGDIDGDGLNDDYSAEGVNAARIVYGDSTYPFFGPSYVSLFDNSREIYPDLPPTKVALVGMLGGKPCIVQSYQVLPDTPPYYELHELNMDDLRARAPKIRTRLLQKLNVGEDRFFGNVILRTPDVWWLFSVYGRDSSPNGMKVTPASMTFEPVSGYWKGAESQYYGQGGGGGDNSYPRVIEGGRPFIRVDYRRSESEEGDTVRHAVFTLARLLDAESATVEILGSGYPLQSQYHEASATNVVMVPDVDDDGIDDFMVTLSYMDTQTKQYQNSVALYLTSQCPVVSVKESVPIPVMRVIDQGERWRIVDGMNCIDGVSTTARIYDINGAVVTTVTLNVTGADVVIDKPRDLSRQALWLRMGKCSVRLQ
jgi:hypothetical protein